VTFPYSILSILSDFSFDRRSWNFADLRIDIEPLSYGSDATNQHTQYSNPIAVLNWRRIEAFGYSFTLGKGNDLVIQCAKAIIDDLDGIRFIDLVIPTNKLYSIANPNQLRWLSPGSGCVYMAAGLILNTLLDLAAKSVGQPLWKLLALSRTEDLVAFINDKEYSHYHSIANCFQQLSVDASTVIERVYEIEEHGLPVYRTTWYFENTSLLCEQISEYRKIEGVTSFKLKINNNPDWVEQRLHEILANCDAPTFISVDANQSLAFSDAKTISQILSKNLILWLEEPFAPDNPSLHHALKQFLKDERLSIPLATGENCPNSHLAIEFMATDSIDIFQLDACRVFSIVDLLPILTSASIFGTKIVPHAGGSGLDELVPHWQAFRLARIDTTEALSDSLMENVGFCSHLFRGHNTVVSGRLKAPSEPGYGVGLTYAKVHLDYDKPKWIKL